MRHRALDATTTVSEPQLNQALVELENFTLEWTCLTRC